MSDLPAVDLSTIDFFPTGPLAEDEQYLWSIMSDRSGIDLAEFLMVDEEKADRCFRLRPYQVSWYKNNDRYQIEQLARDLGKALDVNTPLFTANRGWTTMGEVQVGDVLFDDTGEQCNVTHVYAPLHDRDCYEVVFDDGASIVADGDHEWETLSPVFGRRVHTTREIKRTLTYGADSRIDKPDMYKKWNHAVEMTSPLDYGREVDPAVVASARPAHALEFCWWQRVEVLQRYMDVHGKATNLGRRVSAPSSAGLRSLLRTLGVQFSEDLSTKTLQWSPAGGLNPFLVRADEARPSEGAPRRHVVDVRRVPSREVRCIEVDSKTRLFLAGESFVATHNSMSIILRAIAWPFGFPGQDMLITAPRGVHLKPTTERIEHMFFRSGIRMLNETLISKANGSKQGLSKDPAWSLQFANNARIVTRLPNLDGTGVKGSHIGPSIMVTESGLKRADGVTAGDYVLTGGGRYMRVEHVYEYEVDDAVLVKGKGHSGYVVGPNHRFLARRNRNLKQARALDPEVWMPVFDGEATRHYWATPTTFPALRLPDPPEGCTDAVALLELAGAYVADGAMTRRPNDLSDGAGIHLTGSPDDLDRLRDIAFRAGYSPRSAEQGPSAEVIAIHNYRLAEWVQEHFGALSDAKTIPSWLLGAPRAARETFLTTYLAGGGHWSAPRSRWEVGTASKRLAVGLKLLAQSLGYSTTFSCIDPKVSSINETRLKNKPKRNYRVQMNVGSKHELELDGVQWGKIKSVEPLGSPVVLYDFAVAGDHSYVGDGIISLGTAFLPSGEEA